MRVLVKLVFILTTTCKCRICLAKVFTSSGSEAALHNLLGDSHHQDPRHPLYQNIPHPGGHSVGAGFPAVTAIVEDRESSAIVVFYPDL